MDATSNISGSNDFSSTEPKRILVVDDAADTRLMLNLRLQREGYIVYAAGSGPEALEIVKQEGLPHLVILDIMMPGMDGFAVANELRKIGDVSIIFLSALSDTETKVEGLTRYAEDYITKPFAFTELLAMCAPAPVRTSTERAVDPELVIDEGLRINFAQQYAVVNNQQITLTLQLRIACCTFCTTTAVVLSPGFLLSKAWDPLRKGTVESLWVHIRRLRSKIEADPDNPKYVITVRSQGYCLPQRNQIGTYQ